MKREKTAFTRTQVPQSPIEPKILFEDPHLIVLSKPSGLLSQGALQGEKNLVDWLRNYLKRHYVGLVHRLDRNTSGLMVVAKRTKSAQRLTQALQTDQMKRVYRAWVLGRLESKVTWKHQLKKNEINNEVHIVSKGGKESSLIATPIEVIQWQGVFLTLVEFVLETGRSHQIRVQSAYENYPILGDRKYGKDPRPIRFPRLALHSTYLEFPHPMTSETLIFHDPLPYELQAIRNSS